MKFIYEVNYGPQKGYLYEGIELGFCITEKTKHLDFNLSLPKEQCTLVLTIDTPKRVYPITVYKKITDPQIEKIEKELGCKVLSLVKKENVCSFDLIFEDERSDEQIKKEIITALSLHNR